MEAKDIISRQPVTTEKLLDIIERLYTSDTVASTGGEPAKKAPNAIARAPATEDEMKEIYKRLNTAHTKSTELAVCKTYEPLQPGGYGQKMLPVIAGLETRFAGPALPKEVVEKRVQTLHGTQTTASQARKDNPRHLLYPERTLLMNNVERILEFQEKGSLVKQSLLQRREKWYN